MRGFGVLEDTGLRTKVFTMRFGASDGKGIRAKISRMRALGTHRPSSWDDDFGCGETKASRGVRPQTGDAPGRLMHVGARACTRLFDSRSPAIYRTNAVIPGAPQA